MLILHSFDSFDSINSFVPHNVGGAESNRPRSPSSAVDDNFFVCFHLFYVLDCQKTRVQDIEPRTVTHLQTQVLEEGGKAVFDLVGDQIDDMGDAVLKEKFFLPRCFRVYY